MTLDEAKQTALDHAQRYNRRYYVVCLGDECQALTGDDIENHCLAMAQSPSPVVGYYDPSATDAANFVMLNRC